ncbi:translation initiation factor IF-2 [Candidatus Falkowbacteria bacterium]|nr:translation initiation factor IF-2 [Candidatus Falkowbacteria bacterium]
MQNIAYYKRIMNVTELARKLGVRSSEELLELLPDFGFDVGKRAIKVDDKIASAIIKAWPRIQKELDFRKREQEKKRLEQEKLLRQQMQTVVTVPSVVTVKDFATLINIPVANVIKSLMKNGIMATLNERIDFDTATIIADEFGVTIHASSEEVQEEVATGDRLKAHIEGDSKVMKRPPIIVIMGHVDHGKTRLLDSIRSANVMEGEAGGITQHIGAYQVVRNGKTITFIDTPGHEAFTAMRSRGAKVADIAILVVAADDSIQPQTKEAIKIIKAAGLPMIVAINKIDKPEANIEKVKTDLATENLIPEEWGGNTMIQPISAKSGLNIDKLLDSILLIDEMESAKIIANPDKAAAGTIIESHVDKGEGPVATVLVQSGTLKVGDQLMINDVFYGKVRALKDFTGKDVKEAAPSVPVKILGLKTAPKVGDLVEVQEGKISRDSKKTTTADLIHKEKSVVSNVTKQTNDEEGESKIPTLKAIIKADMLGSLEVLVESLEKLSTDKVKVKILQKGLGNITDNDVTRAADEQAMLLAFHVKPLASAQHLANERDVVISSHTVIYHLIDEVKAKIATIVKPELEKRVIGKVQVLAIFKADKKTMVFGGKVLEGKITIKTKCDIIRNGTLYETGTITGLQSGKMAVQEVANGNDCGIAYSGSSDVAVGDILEVFEEKIIK